METFPKLEKILEAALKQAVLDGGMLIGHELEIKEAEGLIRSKQEYVAKMEDASFIFGVKSQEGYDGIFYMLFSLRDAIVLASLLLGVPPARVSEKRKLAIIEADDVDAFSEFTNQVIGSFNPVFKSSLPNKVHLKLQDPKRYIPQADEVTADSPMPDDEYFVYRARLDIQGQDMDGIDILIPTKLACLFDPRETEDTDAEEKTAAETDAAESEAEAARKPAEERTVLILEDNSADRQLFQEAFSATAIKTIASDLNADLSGFFPNPPVKAVILGISEADDHEFSICVKIRTLSANGPVPVVMCAKEWTRTAVLKALKYGARDIVIKPCEPGELRDKVMRLLAAA